MILDHIGITVVDYQKMRGFYSTALAPLGIKLLREHDAEYGTFCGFGRDKPELWLSRGDKRTEPRLHIALLARSRAEVRAFHEAALAAGAKDNGGPGVRELYHPHYYGAFVLDPEGHNLEAVVHTPESP
jgi:catechol 2,3-dioxygenase-like lactoylglutathione lyase family enzyme